ncbi:MAG TPA: hypothetical protein VMR52_10770 [Dehalococcoidia bacterium]|nr:hypothetical protein [Dehalococcoidia bacterium]
MSANPAPDPAPKARHPNWGGRRKGAGAPKGNLNAFRHGRYSTQQKALARMLTQIPEARTALLRLADARRRHDTAAAEGASLILAEVLRRLGEFVVKPGNNQLEHNQQLIASLRSKPSSTKRRIVIQARLDFNQVGRPSQPAASRIEEQSS